MSGHNNVNASQPTNDRVCKFRKVLDSNGDFDYWELIECNCIQPGGYCMTPDISQPPFSPEDDIVVNACYEIGNTTPELPPENPDDPFQGRTRYSRSGRLNLAVFVRIPEIEREGTSNRFLAKGKWSNLVIDVGNGQWGELRAGGWAISVRRMHPAPLDMIVLPQVQPTSGLNYFDIAAPALVGLPELGPDGISYQIKHYWLTTSNQQLIDGRAFALLITKEWLIKLSRPVLAAV
jgi:hypothetical protein